MKRKSAVAFAVLAALTAGTVQAVDVTASLMNTAYQTTPGVWYNKDMPHVFEQNTPAYSLGLQWAPNDTLRLGVGYRDLGNFKMTAIGLSDDTHPERTSTSTFITDMRVRGFYGEANIGKNFYGVRPFLTGGVFVSRFVTDIKMENMPVGYHDDGEAFGSETAHSSHKAAWVANPYIGAGVEVKRLYFSVSYYKLDDNKSKDGYTPGYTGAVVGAVGVRF